MRRVRTPAAPDLVSNQILRDAGHRIARHGDMARKALIRSPDFPYHITNRSNNREFFLLGHDQLWTLFLEVLEELEIRFNCRIHAFVLMSNHYHLMISTPDSNIGEAMKYFHREIAKKANRESGRINHFFGGRYKWSLITNENYFWNAVKYIFLNPVRAGICRTAQEYKYSSLNSKNQNFEWRLCDFFFDREKSIDLDLEWLNDHFTKEEEHSIRYGLRRTEFCLQRSKSGRMSELAAVRYKKVTT